MGEGAVWFKLPAKNKWYCLPTNGSFHAHYIDGDKGSYLVVVAIDHEAFQLFHAIDIQVRQEFIILYHDNPMVL